MSLDRPRTFDMHPERLTDPAARAATHLVVLADAIEERSDMRARITGDHPRPRQVAKCWNPHGQRPTLIVACQPIAHGDHGALCYHLVGEDRTGRRAERDEILAPADRPEEAADILIERLQAQVRT